MTSIPLVLFRKKDPNDILILTVHKSNINLHISKFKFKELSTDVTDIFEIIFTNGDKLICSYLSEFVVCDKKQQINIKMLLSNVDIDNDLFVFGEKKLQVKSIDFLYRGLIMIKKVFDKNILSFTQFD